MRIGGYSTPIRLSGMNSGLDTESLVDAMLMGDKFKVDKVKQNKQLQQWKIDMYNDINKKLTDFSNKFFSVLSPDNIISPGSFMTHNANYTANNYFNVTATGGVMSNGSYKISNIVTAKAATISGKEGVSQYVEVTGSGFSELTQTNVSSGELQTNGRAQANGDTKLNEIVNSDGQSAFGFKADKDDEVITFSINGTSFTFNENDKLDDVVAKINEKTGDTGVTASLQNGRLNLKSDKTVTLKQTVGNVFGENGGFAGISSGTQEKELKFSTGDTLAKFAEKTGRKLTGENGRLTFSINGQQFDFGEDATLDDVVNTVNGVSKSSGAGVKMSIDSKTGAISIRNTNPNGELNIESTSGTMFGANGVSGINTGRTTKTSTISTSDTIEEAARKMNMTLSGDKLKFKINDVEFEFGKDTKLSDMISKVNSSSAGVTMGYSQITDSFVFTSKNTGADSSIKIENVTEDGVINAFGEGGFFGVSNNSGDTVKGTDAEVTINGKKVTSSTNNFTVDGMSFELKSDMSAEQVPDGYTVTFTQNTDDVVKKIETFVKEYNDLVNELEGLLKEKKDYEFKPLTEEQKKDMSEKEIEEWEKKAKQGLLRNDAALSKLLSDLRGSIFAMVEGAGGSAADIGISTSKKDGTITLDSNKLREALERDPQKVADIFTQKSDAKDPADKYNNSGYANRLNDAMFDFRSTVRKNQIKSANNKIGEYDKQLERLNRRLKENEARYWKRFAALEKAMSSLNSQQNWLLGVMGSM